METLVLEPSLAAEWVSAEYEPLLFVGLLLAGLGTTALFVIGLVAYYRRRTTQYLLITLALGGLVVRTLVGWGTAFGVVPMIGHHIVAHGLDFFVAAVLLYVVSQSRTEPNDPEPAGVSGDDERTDTTP